MMVVPEVLKVVSIFMKDAFNHGLHGGAKVMKHKHGVYLHIITSIGRGISIPKLHDLIVKGPLLRNLSPDVFFHPLNGKTNDLSSLRCR